MLKNETKELAMIVIKLLNFFWRPHRLIMREILKESKLCQKQLSKHNFKRLQLDSNPQPLSS